MPTDRQQYCKKQGCGNRFTRPQGTNRLYCFECKPERKGESNVTQLRTAPTQNGQNSPNPAEDGESDGPLTRKTLLQLEKWGIEETWQAEAVLTLSRQIDSGKGGGSAGVAGAIKAHREAMAVAYAISEVDEADVIEAIFAESS